PTGGVGTREPPRWPGDADRLHGAHHPPPGRRRRAAPAGLVLSGVPGHLRGALPAVRLPLRDEDVGWAGGGAHLRRIYDRRDGPGSRGAGRMGRGRDPVRLRIRFARRVQEGATREPAAHGEVRKRPVETGKQWRRILAARVRQPVDRTTWSDDTEVD